jgi:hypothetical protein
MEGIVRQVFADAGFRSRFLENPEAALAGTGLSDTQRGALTSLSSQMRAQGGADAVRGAPDGMAPMAWL